MLQGLKVWPVSEMVTYGFNVKDAPLELTGVILSTLSCLSIFY